MKKICLNCKYWSINNNDTFGRPKCHLSKLGRLKMYSPCGLYTTEDFGCNLFEEKIFKNNK